MEDDSIANLAEAEIGRGAATAAARLLEEADAADDVNDDDAAADADAPPPVLDSNDLTKEFGAVVGRPLPSLSARAPTLLA